PDDGKNDPLPRLSRERATRWAEEHTARMAEAAGVELDRKSAESIFEECVGRNDEVVRDGRYSLYYTVYAPVARERQTEVARRLRADFEKGGTGSPGTGSTRTTTTAPWSTPGTTRPGSLSRPGR
ncbi:hypothetical protein LO771_16475, partial [Streptacidiphilus sp. ASG 303]|uniref:hypothetical protein n=1 Tax=Streptacidiphilus sp. ASG 303 TaxID=2896847 RepID=UPI001E48B20E